METAPVAAASPFSVPANKKNTRPANTEKRNSEEKPGAAAPASQRASDAGMETAPVAAASPFSVPANKKNTRPANIEAKKKSNPALRQPASQPASQRGMLARRESHP
jgi:hypothetical protein